MSRTQSQGTSITLDEFVTNDFGDSYIPSVNGNLFRDRSAMQIYGERFAAEPFKEYSLYIICGSDSGLFPKYLLSLPQVEGTTFLFIERPEVIEILPSLVPQLDSAEHIRFSSLGDFSEKARALEIEHFFYRNALFLVPSFCILHNPSSVYADLAWRSQQTLDRLSLNLGVRLNNRFFFLTMLQNLAENRTSVHVLDGVFAGRTAVVLGAGPSLDTILPWVRENRDAVDVLAVSRTSKRLLQLGIHPDFVFSIDPQSVSFDVGKEMLLFGENTVFINNTHACPQLVGQWPWRNLYWGTRVPWAPSTDGNPGNTVTHLALWTAIRLGYSQVVLGGVDLCFSREGHTHAQGSAERDAGPNLIRGVVEVETNRGELAETDHQMAQGIEQMGHLAAAAKHRGVRIYNPAPAAARMAGVDHVPLEELAVPWNEEPAKDLLTRSLPAEGSPERTQCYRETLEHLARTKRDLRRIKSLAKGALCQLDRAFRNDSPSAFQKRNRKVDAAEARIRQVYPQLRSTLVQLQAGAFTAVLRPKREDWDPKEIHDASRLVFDNYIRSAEDLIDHLKIVETRLEARLEEEKIVGPDLAKLIRQWERDRQPGRARIWRTRHPELLGDLDNDVARAFERIDGLFEDSLNQVRTISPTLDPGAICRRSASMFERMDREGLERTLAGLREHSGPEAANVQQLIAGYVAELSGLADEGLDRYASASKTAIPEVRVEALRRASVILLRDQKLEAAVDVLRELSSFDSSYRPSYARVLRLAGRFGEAIEQYTTHLSNHPTDTGTMLQLGDLYRDAGAWKPARLAYECVLTIAPDDIQARQRLAVLESRGTAS